MPLDNDTAGNDSSRAPEMGGSNRSSSGQRVRAAGPVTPADWQTIDQPDGSTEHILRVNGGSITGDIRRPGMGSGIIVSSGSGAIMVGRNIRVRAFPSDSQEAGPWGGDHRRSDADVDGEDSSDDDIDLDRPEATHGSTMQIVPEHLRRMGFTSTAAPARSGGNASSRRSGRHGRPEDVLHDATHPARVNRRRRRPNGSRGRNPAASFTDTASQGGISIHRGPGNVQRLDSDEDGTVRFDGDLVIQFGG